MMNTMIYETTKKIKWILNIKVKNLHLEGYYIVCGHKMKKNRLI